MALFFLSCVSRKFFVICDGRKHMFHNAGGPGHPMSVKPRTLLRCYCCCCPLSSSPHSLVEHTQQSSYSHLIKTVSQGPLTCVVVLWNYCDGWAVIFQSNYQPHQRTEGSNAQQRVIYIRERQMSSVVTVMWGGCSSMLYLEMHNWYKIYKTLVCILSDNQVNFALSYT